MSNTIFRIFNPKGHKEDPVERRRGQLRRAQQTYRDRKDKYTKSLEKELAQTRANEAKLMHEADGLRCAVNTLARLLSKHGIKAPDHLLPTIHNVQYSANQRQNTPGSMEEYIYATRAPKSASTPQSQWTSPGSSSDYYATDDQGKLSVQQRNQRPASADSWAEVSNAAIPQQTGRLSNVDLVNVGMEFVLMLERPCLGHIHGNSNKPHEPNGHALTASAQLICASPSLPPEEAASSFQKAPADLLDRLLNLSPNLSRDGEVTPIQAWNYVRCQPQFGGLETQDIWTLTEQLRGAVKCHGFGAVIEQGFFESLVYKKLVVDRAF